MDKDDERVSVPTDSLSWEAIGHAGLRDISEGGTIKFAETATTQSTR